ncbi:MAG TPA: lamin tail domain-containing protein [Pyrinomonadaceae bacterium]|nr:lamin tail domain-containing protein [Pyrinomonadaceae bacterium]
MAQVPPIQAGQVIISELRLRGQAGAEDEFVELYNNTDQDIFVQSTDGTSGWTVAISDGQITGPLFTIDNGTRIPARGHLLGANVNGYSLCNYPSGSGPGGPPVTAAPVGAAAPCVTNGVSGTFTHTTPDRTWDFDVPDGNGVALFSTTNGLNMNAATRLDAFGFTGSPALFREGTGFPNVVTANSEHTYYRDLRNALPKDTTDNAADFLLVGTAISIQITRLGAPGPENLASPIVNNTTITTSLLDPTVAASSPPNRERRPNVEPNADLGVLLIRRTFTNNTTQPVTRLRFRVVNITTIGTPGVECAGGTCADVRALTSQDGEAGSPSIGVVAVRGVRLEEPPEQPAGGGYNASLSADFITGGSPSPAAATQPLTGNDVIALNEPLQPTFSVNIVFKLGVMRDGPFRFFLNIEAQNTVPRIILIDGPSPFGIERPTGRPKSATPIAVPAAAPAPAAPPAPLAPAPVPVAPRYVRATHVIMLKPAKAKSAKAKRVKRVRR